MLNLNTKFNIQFFKIFKKIKDKKRKENKYE